MKTKKTIAEKTRNLNYYLFQKNISEQDEKILLVLQKEKIADSWTLANLSGIFITSTRRSITNLKYSKFIKEVGYETSKVTGARNTLYSLIDLNDAEIDEWKKENEIKKEEELKYNIEVQKAKFETLQKIADYDNKMILNYYVK